jgi:hypothetical protein
MDVPNYPLFGDIEELQRRNPTKNYILDGKYVSIL